MICEMSRVSLGCAISTCSCWAAGRMMRGKIAEMETGEGKTLTATLPAATAALAGIPVHIITVNDYLAARDAAWMKPVYDALGLSVGTVTRGNAARPSGARLRLRRSPTAPTSSWSSTICATAWCSAEGRGSAPQDRGRCTGRDPRAQPAAAARSVLRHRRRGRQRAGRRGAHAADHLGRAGCGRPGAESTARRWMLPARMLAGARLP